MTKKSNKRVNVSYSNRFYPEDKARFQELMAEFNCTQYATNEYLISLESSRIEKGIFIAEKKLKQWLYLGYPKKITTHGLRYADYGFSENRKGELTPRIVSLSTAKSVFELYEAEIQEHNSKFED
tara:strand:+ start:1079 stop:1453 length:375 start_codon:yes stop_codon:yes gene_type:complete